MPSATLEQGVVRRPAALTAAFWSWLGATMFVVFGLPWVFFTAADAVAQGMFDESQRVDEVPMTLGEAELISRLLPVFCAACFAVFAVPYVIATVKLRAGRNWARVLLAVLGGMGLVFGFGMLIGFVAGIPWVNWIVGIVWCLLFLGVTLLGIVLMFLAPSNDYVRLVSRR